MDWSEELWKSVLAEVFIPLIENEIQHRDLSALFVSWWWKKGIFV